MAEHTPGPWHCTTEVPSDEPCLVAWIDDPDYPGERFWLQSDADARLIAAAPELLEALEALYGSAIEGHDDFSRYIAEQAGPAIAKARGES